MAVSPDGAYVFVVAGNQVVIINGTVIGSLPTLDPVSVGNSTSPASLTSLAVAQIAAGLTLYAADTANRRIYILAEQGDTSTAPPFVVQEQSLQYPENSMQIVNLVASPGGHWLYALLQDTTNHRGYVQAVDAYAIERGEPDAALGTRVPIGNYPLAMALADDGRRLYAAYYGSDPTATTGTGEGAGVAVIAVSEAACADIFLRALEPCPECPPNKCEVLATIEDYTYGDSVIDPPDGDGSAGEGEALIDNLKHRRLLPSTDLITDVVRCILEHGIGGGERGEQGQVGPEGPVGPAGPAGPRDQKAEKGVQVPRVHRARPVQVSTWICPISLRSIGHTAKASRRTVSTSRGC